jgi:hypothetical protein
MVECVINEPDLIAACHETKPPEYAKNAAMIVDHAAAVFELWSAAGYSAAMKATGYGRCALSQWCVIGRAAPRLRLVIDRLPPSSYCIYLLAGLPGGLLRQALDQCGGVNASQRCIRQFRHEIDKQFNATRTDGRGPRPTAADFGSPETPPLPKENGASLTIIEAIEVLFQGCGRHPSVLEQEAYKLLLVGVSSVSILGGD